MSILIPALIGCTVLYITYHLSQPVIAMLLKYKYAKNIDLSKVSISFWLYKHYSPDWKKLPTVQKRTVEKAVTYLPESIYPTAICINDYGFTDVFVITIYRHESKFTANPDSAFTTKFIMEIAVDGSVSMKLTNKRLRDSDTEYNAFGMLTEIVKQIPDLIMHDKTTGTYLFV